LLCRGAYSRRFRGHAFVRRKAGIFSWEGVNSGIIILREEGQSRIESGAYGTFYEVNHKLPEIVLNTWIWVGFQAVLSG